MGNNDAVSVSCRTIFLARYDGHFVALSTSNSDMISWWTPREGSTITIFDNVLCMCDAVAILFMQRHIIHCTWASISFCITSQRDDKVVLLRSPLHVDWVRYFVCRNGSGLSLQCACDRWAKQSKSKKNVGMSYHVPWFRAASPQCGRSWDGTPSPREAEDNRERTAQREAPDPVQQSSPCLIVMCEKLRISTHVHHNDEYHPIIGSLAV